MADTRKIGDIVCAIGFTSHRMVIEKITNKICSCYWQDGYGKKLTADYAEELLIP